MWTPTRLRRAFSPFAADGGRHGGLRRVYGERYHWGTDGDDTILAGDGHDSIDGGAGDDMIELANGEFATGMSINGGD